MKRYNIFCLSVELNMKKNDKTPYSKPQQENKNKETNTLNENN